MNPKFLLVQFAEGAGGVFLTSLLCNSTSVGHYDSATELHKTSGACFDYIKKSYTNEVSQWLVKEPRPQNNLNLHFISTKFPRGDDLTPEEFVYLCREHASDHFWNLINQNKLIPMIWHKPHIPEYFNDPIVITILLDESSYKWYHRALWYKKYGIRDCKIHVKADDPEHNPSRAEYFKKFQNPYLLDMHPYTFIKNNILKSEYKNIFNTEENFLDGHNREFITLSEILDIKKLEVALNRICNKFSLDPLDQNFLVNAWAHWKGCHDTVMPKYS